MTFAAYDANGYLGDAASIGGWTAFAKWATLQGDELSRLIRQGSSTDPTRLAVQLNSLSAPDPDVESVRVGLFALAQKAEEILIISEGGE